jgi:hypothetical protein
MNLLARIPRALRLPAFCAVVFLSGVAMAWPTYPLLSVFVTGTGLWWPTAAYTLVGLALGSPGIWAAWQVVFQAYEKPQQWFELTGVKPVDGQRLYRLSFYFAWFVPIVPTMLRFFKSM